MYGIWSFAWWTLSVTRSEWWDGPCKQINQWLHARKSWAICTWDLVHSFVEAFVGVVCVAHSFCSSYFARFFHSKSRAMLGRQAGVVLAFGHFSLAFGCEYCKFSFNESQWISLYCARVIVWRTLIQLKTLTFRNKWEMGNDKTLYLSSWCRFFCCFSVLSSCTEFCFNILILLLLWVLQV